MVALLHTAIAIVLAIGLIIRFKVDPVISLILASLYLGLAAGVGFAGTIEAIAPGFGEIMAEVGLLIGFGVLIGALLHSTGAFHRLVECSSARRRHAAPVRAGHLALHHHAVDLRRRAGGAGLARGPLGAPYIGRRGSR